MNVVATATLGAYRFFGRAVSKTFCLLAAGGFARFGRRSFLALPIRLSGESRIAIGDGVYIGSDCWLQTIGDGADVALEIGDGTSIVGHCVLSAASSVRLGAKVLLARNVYISDHMHAYADVGVAVLDQGLTRIEAVEVCDGAWLGQNVVVCPGVRIGRGAVVGANSVVNRDVPDFSLAVGAPAKVIRTFAKASSRAATSLGSSA